MSAPGNSAARPGACTGFTLLELLLVVAIIAMAGAGVGFALRDLGQTQLEREAQRLIAMLESARARSRASGIAVYWRASGQGFEFIGLAPRDTEQVDTDAGSSQDFRPVMRWLGEGVSVPGGVVVTLGPEPIIPRQEIVLQRPDGMIRIATDGLRPFALQRGPAQAAP